MVGSIPGQEENNTRTVDVVVNEEVLCIGIKTVFRHFLADSEVVICRDVVEKRRRVNCLVFIIFFLTIDLVHDLYDNGYVFLT